VTKTTDGPSSAPVLRVVEIESPLTRFAGRLLAGLGHHVTVVLSSAPSPDDLDLLHWHACKLCVVAPPDEEGAQRQLRSLASNADVLIDGRPPASDDPLARWLAARNPRLVHVRVTPFGLTGPHAGWQATDLVLCAAGGILAQVGRPDGPPLALPANQAEHLAGNHAATAALLGAVHLQRTGKGQLADVSAQECVAASLEAGALLYIHEDRVPPRPGGQHPLVPHRLMRASDGHLAVGLGGNPAMFARLVQWLDEEGSAQDLTDTRWLDPRTRSQELEHIFEVLQSFVGPRTKEALAAEAQQRRLPWASVDDMPAIAHNPQLSSRKFLIDVAGRSITGQDVGFPFAWPEAPAGLLRPGTCHAVTRAPTLSDAGVSSPEEAAPVLSGIRVLDLTWVLAGPYATRILADHGADVIKVESGSRPDPTRYADFMHLSRTPGDTDPNTSGYFNNVNRNKRSITLNLRADGAAGVIERLVAACDVVVENFSAGVMDRMGLSYEQMRQLNPSVIYLSMSGMGHTGPRRGWVSYADAVSAWSGLSGLTGKDGDVTGVVFGYADIVAGQHGALAVIAALLRRSATGEGCHIDLSQLETVTSQLGPSMLHWTAGGLTDRSVGNRHPRYAPHGVFRCLGDDRWLAVTVRDDSEWVSLTEIMAAPGLAQDPRFSRGASRHRNETELEEIVAEWARTQPAAWAAERLQAAGIPASVVQTGADLIEHDAHMRDRGFYVPVVHPVAGHALLEGIPIRLSRTPGSIRAPAPVLGIDTDRVLRDVGYDAEDVEKLRVDGVLS